MATHQPGLAILEQDVAVDQLGLAGTQAFNFPTGQGQAGLELLFDEIIVQRLFVLRDAALLLFLLLSHRARIIGTGGCAGDCPRSFSGVLLRVTGRIELEGAKRIPDNAACYAHPPGAGPQ
ncbi:hypothetical protein D3C77_677900 [compost metagenome]